jgi:putative flippase GtrA
MRTLLVKLGINNRASFLALLLQFIKFGVVGVSNTLISLAVYYALVYAGLYYILANIVSFAVSVLNAYYWNRRFVFKGTKKGTSGQTLGRTYLSYGVTFLLSMGLLYTMVDVLHISPYLAPILNLCMTVPLNFLLSKFWAFK